MPGSTVAAAHELRRKTAAADEEQHGSGHLQRDERVPGAAGTGITHHLAAHRPHQLDARRL